MRGNVERLAAFEAELKDPARQTGRVAAVLSEAMLLRENEDHGVSMALRPAIADAIKSSVRADPQPVVEAVSPIIGPAIRRSVNEAIAAMLERLDKLLEHNFSWQALRWRIEALRTGRNYAEVVLLRTLVYRVEQVLLIHCVFQTKSATDSIAKLPPIPRQACH
jgi:OOP family OmpA-OmpF porin